MKFEIDIRELPKEVEGVPFLWANFICLCGDQPEQRAIRSKSLPEAPLMRAAEIQNFFRNVGEVIGQHFSPDSFPKYEEKTLPDGKKVSVVI